MEPFVKKAFSPALKEKIFRHLQLDQEAVEDLNGFENFVYGASEEVIRITHSSHRSQSQILAEVEFIAHLADHGAAVARPIAFDDGGYLYSISEPEGEFHVSRFQRALGSMDKSLPTDAVVREWGRCLGQFHRLAIDFKTAHRRQNWAEDENHQFANRIPAEQEKVLQASKELMVELGNLSHDKKVFGLIHSDAHAGNFNIHEGKLTFFDFDDCLYAWYGYDIATILVGIILRSEMQQPEKNIVEVVEAFMTVFLKGYETEQDRSSLMFEAMPTFLKLRELSLYAVIHAHDAVDDNDAFIDHFMKNRRARIENVVPFVDFDFSVFST